MVMAAAIAWQDGGANALDAQGRLGHIGGRGKAAMVEGIESVGEAVTGGMAARAVEPDAGERTHGEGQCLNCGAALQGDYCHRCGQKGHVHRTLGAWWHDLVHGVLHLDGKVWRTLPLLVWRPGDLTRRYVEGERARFVSPMAMFLFSVFMMFAIFSAMGSPFEEAGNVITADARTEARAEFVSERSESLAELEALRAERAEQVAAGEETNSVDVEIRVTENAIALQERLYRRALERINEREARAAAKAQAKAGPEVTTEVTKSGTATNAAGAVAEDTLIDFKGEKTDLDWVNDAYRKAKANPDLLLYKLQTNAYKFSWALIPLSVPFVWLMFLHRRRYRQYKAYDHTVFVTYSIAFMSLGLIVLTVLLPLGISDGWFWTAIAFIPPVHIYRQLRGAYRLPWWSALWRTILLIHFAFIAVGLFAAGLLTFGVLG
jgi:hypothetical protein